MQYKKTLVLLMVLSLATACKQQASADAAASSTSNASASATENPTSQAVATEQSAKDLLEKKLTKQMPYAELRKIVLGDGWLPLVTPQCKENVGGEALACDKQPELESCSGDGHCNMQFSHSESQIKLRVGTYADNTKFWEFSDLENPDNAIGNGGIESVPGADLLAAEACTQKGYWSFFEQFVKSEAIRKTHTSPKVELRSYSGKAKIEGQYEQFKIGMYDNTWIYIDPIKKTEKVQRLELKDEVSGNTFRVNYQKAEFGSDEQLLKKIGKPGAYVFELQNACWRLTQELR